MVLGCPRDGEGRRPRLAQQPGADFVMAEIRARSPAGTRAAPRLADDGGRRPSERAEAALELADVVEQRRRHDRPIRARAQHLDRATGHSNRVLTVGIGETRPEPLLSFAQPTRHPGFVGTRRATRANEPRIGERDDPIRSQERHPPSARRVEDVAQYARKDQHYKEKHRHRVLADAQIAGGPRSGDEPLEDGGTVKGR